VGGGGGERERERESEKERLSVCVPVCITKSKVVVKEIKVRTSRMFQLSSVLLGCAIYQALLLVYVPVSVDGAALQTVSTTLLFYTLI
jgi:hypothetical protein